eukprot:TRINITY_DN16140_c0_g1_i1.p1 TRINITY_DN16140_c0_g1~~TRINITY_DN16140_c0_g1_i1.p1  ORF type:complete len:408 (+),score=24.48 TRINITY_DN16140_c0_g1_i1:60-1226(+)
MSTQDQAAAAVLARVALAFDGAVLGIALAVAAVRTWLKFNSSSAALEKIRHAPTIRISDLRSLLSTDASNDDSNDAKLLFVRGQVQAKSSAEGSWSNLKTNVLVSQESGDRAVVVQRTQTCLYKEWRGLFGWTLDLQTLFTRSWGEEQSTSLRTVPFILVEGAQWARSDYVLVNLDNSTHPLPLTTVYQQLHPVQASPYTFLQAIFGHGYPVGLLDVEKILPLGKEITAVGVCCSKDGVPEINSCKDLPYFLSDMTKDQMEVDLDIRTTVMFWSGILLGTLSIGVLGYSIIRNWCKWREWRDSRRSLQSQRDATTAESNADAAEEESGDVPDGELCVICLMRRRRSAFVPCGHLVCCTMCALSVQRDLTPKCPVCRQNIRNSVRIYGF